MEQNLTSTDIDHNILIRNDVLSRFFIRVNSNEVHKINSEAQRVNMDPPPHTQSLLNHTNCNCGHCNNNIFTGSFQNLSWEGTFRNVLCRKKKSACIKRWSETWRQVPLVQTCSGQYLNMGLIDLLLILHCSGTQHSWNIDGPVEILLSKGLVFVLRTTVLIWSTTHCVWRAHTCTTCANKCL